MPSCNVPFPPMEAQLVPEIPEGNWLYEPKWDGFRGVGENARDEVGGDAIATRSRRTSACSMIPPIPPIAEPNRMPTRIES